MTRQRLLRWARPAVGTATVAALVWRVGAQPFLDGVRSIDVSSVVLACAITVLTTIAAAWRWRMVADRVGVDLPMRQAVPAYYRSQFLNATLPGGLLGDVERALRHGRAVGDMGRAAGSVVGERVGGQVVQLGLTAAVLLVVPSPVQSAMPAVMVLAAGAGVAAALAVLLGAGTRAGTWVRVHVRALRPTVAHDAERLQQRTLWLPVLLASTVVVIGHVAVFVVAAKVLGSDVPPSRVLPLAFVILAASALPTNLAGWGPREGAAAWVFAAAGLGGATGVSVATAYGVLAFVATLPGAVVIVAARGPWRRTARRATALPTAIMCEGATADG